MNQRELKTGKNRKNYNAIRNSMQLNRHIRGEKRFGKEDLHKEKEWWKERKREMFKDNVKAMRM